MFPGFMKCLFMLVLCNIHLPFLVTGVAERDCGDHYYYSEHFQMCHPCGGCLNEEPCNIYTGICKDGCADWWYPPNQCYYYTGADYAAGALSHLAEGPDVTDVTRNSVTVCFNQNETFMNREFSNIYAFQIQYAEKQSVDFQDDVDYIPVSDVIRICRTVSDLNSGFDYRLRVVIVRTFEQRLYEAIEVSGAVATKTECDVPVRPLILRGIILESLTAIRIEWEKFSWPQCASYQELKLWYKTLNATSETPIWIQQSQTAQTVYNLIPGQPYRFKLNTINNAKLEAYSPYFEVNLIREEYNRQQNPNSEAAVSGDNDDSSSSDDANFLISIVLAAVAMVIAIIAIVLAIILFMKLKRTQQAKPPIPDIAFVNSVAPGVTTQPSYLQPRTTAGSDGPAVPPPRWASTNGGQYECLSENRGDTGQYLHCVNNSPYSYAKAECGDGNPTYDVL